MASPIPETTASLLPKIPFRQILWSKKVKIGGGSYAQVFEVKHNLESPCAAKKLLFPRPSTNNNESDAVMKSNFFRLCDLWSRLRHHNVVQFLGICYPSEDETGLPSMILEKMQGSVTSLLKEYDDIPLLVKLSILYDASLGLLYLHTHNPPIVHRDVTSNNIMLTPYLEAKITDPFIKTMMTEGTDKKISFSLPILSSDDAYRRNVNLQSELQVDVFSFGKLILHVVTHQEPIPLKLNDSYISRIEQYQECIGMITGDHTAELSDLITGCLEPKNKPQWHTPGSLALDHITYRLNEIKTMCRKKYTRDSTDPLAWLSEIKQISLPTHIPLQIPSEYSKLDLFNDNICIDWKETELPVGIGYECYINNSTAVLLNGTIYLGGARNVICIYHPNINKWDCDNAIKTPQKNCGFTVLTNKLVIAGGLKEKATDNQKKEITNDVLIWEDGKWIEYPKMPTARYATTAIGYQSQLIVMGGCSDFRHPNSIVEVLTTTLQWFTCNSLPHPLSCVKSVIKGNILYVLGGSSDNASSTEEFTQSKHSKRVYATSLHTLPDHHLNWQRLTDTPWYGSSIANLDNHVLAVGGIETHDDTVCVLRSKTGSLITSTSWEPIGTLPVGNLFNSAVIGLDNRIIVYGGGVYSKSNYDIIERTHLSTHMYVGTVRTSLTAPNHSNS